MNIHAGSFETLLVALVKSRLQQLLIQAVQAEMEEFLAAHKSLTDEKDNQRIIAGEHCLERYIDTVFGTVKVLIPKSHDLGGKEIQFNSVLLPGDLNKLDGKAQMLVNLFLSSMCAGDPGFFLCRLLGNYSDSLTGAMLTSLRQLWRSEHLASRHESLSSKNYKQILAGTIWRNDSPKIQRCYLIVLGNETSGNIDLLALVAASASTEETWSEIVSDLRKRGLAGKIVHTPAASHGPYGEPAAVDLNIVFPGGAPVQQLQGGLP